MWSFLPSNTIRSTCTSSRFFGHATSRDCPRSSIAIDPPRNRSFNYDVIQLLRLFTRAAIFKCKSLLNKKLKTDHFTTASFLGSNQSTSIYCATGRSRMLQSIASADSWSLSESRVLMAQRTCRRDARWISKCRNGAEGASSPSTVPSLLVKQEKSSTCWPFPRFLFQCRPGDLKLMWRIM